MYNAHAHRHTQPSSHILIFPNWQHSPYLARNLHSSYVQKLTSIPYLPTHSAKKLKNNTKLNIYLVANEKALRLLDPDYITQTLHETLSTILGRNAQPITLTLNLQDPSQLDSSQAYALKTLLYLAAGEEEEDDEQEDMAYVAGSFNLL